MYVGMVAHVHVRVRLWGGVYVAHCTYLPSNLLLCSTPSLLFVLLQAANAAEEEKREKEKAENDAWRAPGVTGDVAGEEGGDDATIKTVETNIAIAGNGDFKANNSALVIEQMFKLKDVRAFILRKIKYFRTKVCLCVMRRSSFTTCAAYAAKSDTSSFAS
jgi:hypothetical protein